MKTSIVFVVYEFPVLSETFVVSNIIEAIKQGYEVSIITNKKHKHTSSSQQQVIKDYNLLAYTYEVPHLPKSRWSKLLMLFKYGLNPLLLYYFVKYCLHQSAFQFKYLLLLQFYKRFRSASVIHVHFATNAKQVSILKQIGFINSKLMVTFHGYDAHFSDELQKKEMIKRYKPYYAYWDKVTTNSDYLKEQVIQLDYPKAKISVVPMSIDLDFFTPTSISKLCSNNGVFSLLSVGRLISFKGHEYGIKAVKILVDQGIAVSYTIVGAGELFDELNTLIKQLDLEGKVHLYGKATQKDIYELLDTTDVFLMTSIYDTEGRAETQGVVMAEAQAMGLPVVGFATGGVPEHVAHPELLVQEKDPLALSKALKGILLNKEHYTTLSTEIRQWTRARYNVQHMVKQYYSNLVR